MGKCLLISMCETLGSQYWKLGRKKREKGERKGRKEGGRGRGEIEEHRFITCMSERLGMVAHA